MIYIISYTYINIIIINIFKNHKIFIILRTWFKNLYFSETVIYYIGYACTILLIAIVDIESDLEK